MGRFICREIAFGSPLPLGLQGFFADNDVFYNDAEHAEAALGLPAGACRWAPQKPMMLQEVAPITGQPHPENMLPSISHFSPYLYPPHGGLHGDWGTTWDHAIEICTVDDICTDDNAFCRNVYRLLLTPRLPSQPCLLGWPWAMPSHPPSSRYPHAIRTPTYATCLQCGTPSRRRAGSTPRPATEPLCTKSDAIPIKYDARGRDGSRYSGQRAFRAVPSGHRRPPDSLCPTGPPHRPAKRQRSTRWLCSRRADCLLSRECGQCTSATLGLHLFLVLTIP